MGTISVAAAQTTDGSRAGFALDRFSVSERGSDWFTLESLDFRGHLRPAVGLVVEWAHKPLVIYDQETGDEVAALVENQLVTHVGASLILKDRLRLAADMPFILWQSGESATLRDMTFDPPSSTALGDLRLGADVRVVGEYHDKATLAIGAQVEIPTGSQENFGSDGKVRLALRALLAGQVKSFVYALKAGFLYRGQDTPVDGTPFGSELFVAAAVGFRADHDRLVVGPELYGSSVVSDSDAFLKRRSTPLELLLGAHYRVARDWNAGLAVGPGLSRAFGTPELRIIASLEWAPGPRVPPPPPPVEPPPPPETPVPVPPPPPPDRDGDGVIDSEDACPDVPGVRTDDPTTNGCPPPPPDTDGDGIIDPEDACPTVPGPRDPDPKKNGCPLVRIETGQIRILDQIKFKFNSDKILPVSEPILRGVVEIMEQHPEILHVTIQGHTDNVGKKAYNKKLSFRRARSVSRWLIKAGIARQRLAFEGYGMDVPIDTNDTDEGRQNNRRVEFHIDEQVKP